MHLSLSAKDFWVNRIRPEGKQICFSQFSCENYGSYNVPAIKDHLMIIQISQPTLGVDKENPQFYQHP